MLRTAWYPGVIQRDQVGRFWHADCSVTRRCLVAATEIQGTVKDENKTSRKMHRNSSNIGCITEGVSLGASHLNI